MNKEPNVLGLGMITNDELKVWLKVLQSDCFDKETGELLRPGMTDPEEILRELNLINELLILQKTKMLLTRKKGLKDMIDARLDKECGFKFKNQNVRKR